MKSTMSGTAILVVCFILAASAQQRTEIKEEPAHKVYVLSGCLEASGAPPVFKLTRATAVGQTQAPRPTQSGAAGSTAPDVYELQPVLNFTEQGLKREELQSHVGKQVEVTIRPLEVPAPAPPVPADSKVRPENAPPQRYTVSKIGTVAESCAVR
jgi:hypothetical protein